MNARPCTKCVVFATGFLALVRLSEQADLCASMPCQQEGVCIEGPSDYTCNCKTGWRGDHCEKDKNECRRYTKPKYCVQPIRCKNYPGGFDCFCPAGLSEPWCTGPDLMCQSQPCVQNATCIEMRVSHACDCNNGMAELCFEDKTQCTLEKCVKYGVCERRESTYRCHCPNGYEGASCEMPVNECSSNPCVNGGKCIDQHMGYECRCPIGTTGSSCEFDRDECLSTPCRNDGTCIDLSEGFRCLCDDMYTGTQCQIVVRACLFNACQNGGTCFNDSALVTCICVEGYAGTICDLDVDECQSQPCRGIAECVNLVNGFTCEIPPTVSVAPVEVEIEPAAASTDNAVVSTVLGGAIAVAALLAAAIVVSHLKQRADRMNYLNEYEPSDQSLTKDASTLAPNRRG